MLQAIGDELSSCAAEVGGTLVEPARALLRSRHEEVARLQGELVRAKETLEREQQRTDALVEQNDYLFGLKAARAEA